MQKKKKELRAEAELLKIKMMEEDDNLREAGNILENDYDEDLLFD